MESQDIKRTLKRYEKAPLGAPLPEMDPTRRPPRTIQFQEEPVPGQDKVPLRLLADYWMARHAEECHPDEPIVLGLLDDIDITDKGDHRIWVDNGQVFLFVKCPNGIHELTASALSLILMQSFAEAGLGINYVLPGGSITCTVENQLGCHTRFGKEPDASIVLRDGRTGAQLYPIITCEVAAHHENIHHLACEGATWLNSRTDVWYCVIIKLDPRTGQIIVYQLERSAAVEQPLDPFLAVERKKRKLAKKNTKKEAEALSRKKPKRHCSEFDPEDMTSPERFEARYQVKIIKKYVIGPNDAATAELVFELGKLFSRSTIPASLHENRILVVTIDSVIEVAREQIEKYNERKLAKDSEKERLEELSDVETGTDEETDEDDSIAAEEAGPSIPRCSGRTKRRTE